MRITGLHLRAYGHFTGCSLDFGDAPGLHLVYGHNEAGKSTTLRALSSVLFGYPHGVVDGFKHDARDIAIGIDLLAADGRTLSFVRRRRGKRTLTAADESALDESAVENFLGGVSRDVFEKVFALDHHRLRAHAQALLADGGSLGFSLAEAGSGIAGLKAVLDKLKTERAGLFLAGGSRPKLNQAIAECVRLRKEARQYTVSPAEYRNHEKRIQETLSELARLRARRKEIESGVVRLQRIAKNLPLRAEHRALTHRIEALDDVPLLPPEFAQQRIKASAGLDAARMDLDTASAAIADLEQRIAAIAVDADILARGDDIESLAQRRPVIEKQEADRPRWEAERDGLRARVADLMAKAEMLRPSLDSAADFAALLPSALKRKAIQTHADAGKKIMAQRTTLLDNADIAARALNKARDRAEKIPQPRPAGDLARAMTAADKLGDIAAEIARRASAVERKTKALHGTIASLGVPLPPGAAAGPEVDRVALLRELAVPPEKTEARYADAFADVSRKLKEARAEFERLDAELTRAGERIIAMKTTGDVATKEDLKAARDERDHGWALVRGLYVDRLSGLEEAARRFAPDGRIAEVYEAHVREADRVVDTLRSRVKESTELELLKRQAAAIETKKAEVAQELTVLKARCDALLSEWRALWPAGLLTVQSPGEMMDWMARRSAALAAAAELDEERDAVRVLADRERDARQALAAALTAFIEADALSGGLDVLRDRARDIIDESTQARSLYEKAEAALRGFLEQKTQADEAVAKIESRLQAWAVNWQKALTEAGLPRDHTIEAATATLEVIGEIDGLRSKIDELNRRIDAARADRDAFGRAVAGIAAAITDAPAGTAVEVCRRLEERLRTARHAAMERKGLVEQLQMRAADRERAGDKLRRSALTIEALCVQAGGVEPDRLAEIERQSADKRDALRDREKIETRVREEGDGRDVAALFEECDEVPADRITAELISLKADCDETEAGIDRLMAERARLQADFDSLLGQNQAADLAQEAAAVEAEIAEAVESYVDLTVQEALLRAAIDVYRDRNQGPILTRARNLFVQLTGGAYTGLRADVEDGETILIVEDAARGSLGLDALSDGTVDAVYLALRLAVVQEHNATHEPLPFIADDLLLNLDNKRSEAALRTLADVATSSQVLLFTHHAHMADLAARAVPPGILALHNLSERRQPANG